MLLRRTESLPFLDSRRPVLVRDAALDDPSLLEWSRALADMLPLRSVAAPAAAAIAVREGRWRGSSRRRGVVILTSPAECWLLPLFRNARLFYYARDNFAQGYGWSEARVGWYEARIARRCERIVAVSGALAAKIQERSGVSSDRFVISPNAVPQELISAESPQPRRASPGSPPVAGVLGRVSSRLRLGWLRRAVDALPWLHWRFAGEVEEKELRREDRGDLDWLRRHPRCEFLGHLPYRELVRQAADVDLGVIPYSDRSVNPWGSPARFFMHLSAGRPLLGTPGCRQLHEFEPLIALCDDADQLIDRLEGLRRCNFDDGRGAARIEAASNHTWERRAALMTALIQGRAETDGG